MESSDARKEVSLKLPEEEEGNKEILSANSSAEEAGSSSRKDVLADALVKVFERLLNGQRGSNDPQLDSCTSDSELSEVESSSSRDVHSDEEGSTKNQGSENLQDASSTNDSPRPTEAKTTEDPEGQPDTHESASVPVIFKLPPSVENVLNIERFNMSRLLRDEYIDKIRRGRQKLRRVRAKNEEKNGELVSKFQDEVKALLESAELGEIGEVKGASPQRRKLTATPSCDSGIVDPVEQDKDEVVKKYKELLEKTRRDLNRAHRALKARGIRNKGVKDEMAAMKGNVKEANNDLDELEEKRSDLDHERRGLLGKIKDAQSSASVNNEEHATDKQVQDMEDKIQKLCEEKMNAEEEIKELQRQLIAGTGGEDILKDLQEKLTDVNNVKSSLEEKCSELENEMVKKDEGFEIAMKVKEEEVSELQRKLVAGTGGEDILKELQGKLERAKDEKLEIEEKCSGLEKGVREKEDRLRDIEGEMEALEKKSVEGTGAEEIVEKLQEKLNETKAEKAEVEEKYQQLENDAEERNKELRDTKERQEQEINELQRKLVAGTGGEEILKDLQENLQEANEQSNSMEAKNSELQKEIERKEKAFSDEKTKMGTEINELQRKLLAGTGGEEVLKELQEKIQEAKEQNSSLNERNSELQKQIEGKDKDFSDNEKKMKEEINELQRKLVAGSGGEEILENLQKNLQEAKEKNSSLEQKNSELQNEVKENENTFCDKEKRMVDEINDLQRKLVAGTGGEDMLSELQDKLRQAEHDKSSLQTKCKELEDKGKEHDKKLIDLITEKENEISELQKKMVSGTGGEEILAELQNKLKKSKEENATLQTKCEELEGKAKAKDEQFHDEIKTKENEISELQRKLVSGTGGEEILAELQDKLQEAREEKTALQTTCDNLEGQVKAKDEEFHDEIKGKENEIRDLQERSVSGTGGEEILAKLQDKLEKTKEEKAALQEKCEDLEDKAKAKDKEFVDEIKTKDNEINDLQKKLVSGTGGEEVLTELQDKVKEANNEKVAFQTRCKELEDMAKAHDKEFDNEIKEKENEISDLQKKLISGMGGEEVLAELQDTLKDAKEENAALKTTCSQLEEDATMKEKGLRNEIEEKECEIQNLQKQLVSGTGCEEMLTELQDNLKITKEENASLQTKCEELEAKAKAKDEQLGDEIKAKENEISDLQKKLVSGTGGEEILAELQDKLKEAREEKTVLQTTCDNLENKVKAKDKEYGDEIKGKENEIRDLQERLVSGTGGEEILAKLQDKLEKTKEDKAALQEKCVDLEDKAKAKDKEFVDEIKTKDNEINDLQKKLVSGTGGEEVLTELQDKVKEANNEKVAVQTRCEELEDMAKAHDKEFHDEIKEKENEINDLQKKLMSGTGGEEVLAELQGKLKEAKEENVALKTTCSELEKDATTKEKDLGDEIKEKENEISDLQKKLINGTGGEEVLAELQDNLKEAKEENVALKTTCSELEKDATTKEKDLRDEVKEKENEISDLQKKLINGMGGEEVLAELQDKLKEAKEENEALKTTCSHLKEDATTKEKGLGDEIEKKECEIQNLQKQLVSGTGCEEMLTDLLDKLKMAKEENASLQKKCDALEARAKAKDGQFGDEIKRKENEISDLQKKLVSGTGGEKILAELQDKLKEAREEKAVSQTTCDNLQNKVKAKDTQYGDEIKGKENEIRDLQERLVSGTGGEEILAELQDKLEKTKEEKAALQEKCEDLEDKAKAKDKQFVDEIKIKDNEINDLQKKLVSGTGGEAVLTELQDKVKEANEENIALQTRCKELEDMAKAHDKEFDDKIKEKENEISDLQKKLMSGTGGEEVLLELQDRLKEAKEENAALKTTCSELEENTTTKEKDLRDEIEEKECEIQNLQKQLVSGTGCEEMLTDLQDKLKIVKEENATLQTKCDNLEGKVRAKDKEYRDEIKGKENEIRDLQEKLVSGTGGEEILAELQDKLEQTKEEKAALQEKCEDLEDKAKAKDKQFVDEIKIKDIDINNLQKKLVSGTGGEEVLTELQDKVKEANNEKVALQTRCKELEDMAKAHDKEFDDEIKEKENEISDLQKKLMSGTGGEEVLAELQDKLKEAKEENASLKTTCSELEEDATTKEKDLRDEIKEKENEISDLQKKLISGTGGEEVLLELQDKLKEAKEENVALKTTCSELEENTTTKEKDLRDEIKEKENEISDLQKKLINGTGGEEVLGELQDKLKEAKEENEALKTTCSQLEEDATTKEKDLRDEIKEKENEISDLQKKLINGTGGEEVLGELQDKLKEAKEENVALKATCSQLEEDATTKEKALRDEIEEKECEIQNLQKQLVSGTGCEEILSELQDKLKMAKEENANLQTKCEELEAGAKAKDRQFGDEIKRKENEISDLQKKLVSGTGGEEILAELQDKLKEARGEKAVLQAKEEKFAKQLNDKQEEINKLQRDLVEGTKAEDVLVDLQEQLARADKETKKLEATCHELETCTRQRNLDGDDGKELKHLQAANKVLENENKVKQDKIDELQFKMIQGTEGEDVLKDLQNDLNEVNERNKQLKVRNAELEGNDLDEHEQENIAAVLKEENERLEAVNEKMIEKLENLQKDVVNGTGSEELLQKLQNEIKELSSENSELRKKEREMEAVARGGKDLKRLEKDLNRANLDKKRLILENESKDEEITDLQNKLVAGSGGEELLGNLQQEIKALKDANKNMAIQCDDLEDLNKDMSDANEKCKKTEKELFMAKKENEKLAKENESKDQKVREIQKLMVEGSGAEKVLQILEDKIKETTEENKMLEKKCSDLESDTVVLVEDNELLQQRLIDLAEAENEIERLAQDCEEKDRQIVELQRKLVAGTGGEIILKELQDQVKELQGSNNELERKLAKTTKDAIALEGLKKSDKDRKSGRNAPCRFGSQRTDDKNEAFDGLVHRDETEVEDEDINEPITYEQCLQVIPEIKEEKDYWREKYKALRVKVGGQFVDIIPDVWNEETLLEKEREEILSQLTKLRQEISERETPVVKAVSEKERIEAELRKVEDDLEVCSGNLGQLHDIRNKQKLIGKNEETLMECLHELGLKTDSLQEREGKDEKSSEVSMTGDGSEMEALERNLEQLHNEVEELLTKEHNLKGREKDIDCLVDEKISTENEVQEIKAAIQNLQQGLSTKNNLNQSRAGEESEGINNELEKVQHEINILQSSLETPNFSSGQEVNNLLALMKEKSKLEDELTDTEKSLKQLGKREYETLVKERETHENVAKKLLELSREKEVVEGELQDVKTLAQEKESELVKSFSTELKSKEASGTSTKKRRGFRKKKSSLEDKSEDSGPASSAEEGFSDIDLGEPPLPSDSTLALTEELGSLIQKKSSLAVRLEGLGKEITAQSLKVEKSLLGVKDDPAGEPSLGAGYVSVEDLTQSQMSIFDDYNMVDELSLATNIVRDERVKRKSSRKAPLSKLLKEKSSLEKKLKESQGKVLVQNTKVKNALKDEKDAGKSKEKFVQAVQDRKSVDNELSNVCRKIDDIASEDGSVKDKKAKTPKSGKSLSKNDKRRLLSQRESLSQQLDAIKQKIENFSVDGEDTGLADFPEMRETGNVGSTVERLRELIAREAELKQELDRRRKEDNELLNESVSFGMAGGKGGGEMLNKSGKLGKDDDRKVDMKGSGMMSDSGDSSSLDEGAEGMLDNRGELGKRDDKGGHIKDVGTSSDSSALDESFGNKGMLKEMFRDLGKQVKNVSTAKEENETETRPQTEDTSNTNNDDWKASLVEKDAQSQKNTFSVSQHTRYPKDTMLNSDSDAEIVADNSTPYSDVMDVLVKEKAKKEARLRDLEKQIENEKSGGDKTKDVELASQRKREDLKNKMKLALKELEERKETLDESENVLRTATKAIDEDPEQILEDNRIALTQQKDKLKSDLVAVEDQLSKQTQSDESGEDISADYKVYKDVKGKEKDLVDELDKVNEKLHRRKTWTAIDSPEEDNTNLPEAYVDILKRMSEENLNMADLIFELEETKETLSKEREITRELLELIQSRVGNELLEALMGEEGLHSPSFEIREMGMFDGEEYPELHDEVENDIVTVAEVIDDYKKVNQFLFKENQKLHEKVELLKAKVDEDLFASIVDQESLDIEVSKKHEIAKILENNKTLFEQIVSHTSSENAVRIMEDESLKMELEGVRNGDKGSDLSRMKEKVEDISTELEKTKKRKEELVQGLNDLEKNLNSSEETFETAGEERRYSTAKDDSPLNEFNESQNQKGMDGSLQNQQELKELDVSKEKVGISDGLDDIQNLVDLTKEGDDLRPKDQDKILQDISSSLKEAEELGSRIDSELGRLNKDLTETEREIPEARDSPRKGESMKQSDGLESDLKNGNQNLSDRDDREYNKDDRRYRKENRGYGEESNEDDMQDNEGLNEKVSCVENLQKEFVAKLDEVEKLQGELKRNTQLETKTQSLKKEISETIAKMNEARKKRDEILGEFESLQKEKENIDDHLCTVEKENSELKEKMADLQNNKEELTTKLCESNNTKDETAAELKILQDEREALKQMPSLLEKANEEMKEKILDLQNENEEITARLNEANENNKQLARDVEDLNVENKSLDDLLDAQRKENHKLQEEIQCGKDELHVKLNESEQVRQELSENYEEKIGTLQNENKELNEVVRSLKNENEEGIVTLNEADQVRPEVPGDYEEKIGTLENENKELNEVIRALKNENEEGIVKLNEINESIKENEEKFKALQHLERENESLKERLGHVENENKELKDKMQDHESVKETLALLENENHEIIPKMERLEKITKEQEDEIEYLRKEEKDFESLKEKLKKAEVDRENIEEELGVLKNDMKETEDFVREKLNQDVGDGVMSALEQYKERYEETENQNKFLKEEVETMKKVQNVVGDSLSEKLLELSKEGLILNDTQDVPRCVDGLVNRDKNTLANVLNKYENDLGKVKQHLGEDLFSRVVDNDVGLDGEESEQPLKMVDELRNGRHIKEIVREYEDLINSQASDKETAEHLQEKVNALEEEMNTLRKQRDDVPAEDKSSGGDDLRNQKEPDGENGVKVGASEAALLGGNVLLIFLDTLVIYLLLTSGISI